MEAVGIDVVDLATKVGLDGYPLKESVSPSDVPHGWRFDIVFFESYQLPYLRSDKEGKNRIGIKTAYKSVLP